MLVNKSLILLFFTRFHYGIFAWIRLLTVCLVIQMTCWICRICRTVLRFFSQLEIRSVVYGIRSIHRERLYALWNNILGAMRLGKIRFFCEFSWKYGNVLWIHSSWTLECLFLTESFQEMCWFLVLWILDWINYSILHTRADVDLFCKKFIIRYP